MKKKIVIGLAALGTAVALVPLFAAFEAHVINVTAKIENALSVSSTELDFGTVFPQEELDQQFDVQLSNSFLAEDRVDDVQYFIRQKPKCGWTLNGGTNLLGLPTATGHVVVGTPTELPQYATQHDGYYVQCPDPGSPLRPAGAVYSELPSLCPYLSKHETTEDLDQSGRDNDGSLNAFHQPFTIDPNGGIDWNDVTGYLAKSVNDEADIWNIDLKVPCFGGYCAQDWEKYVDDINPGTNPALYTQPISNEHKVFGCDLWVEVNGVSRFGDVEP